ncbi:hypothetical protein P261_00553 [Lachnospiraceae bacterium TWA4]|nr:hypothetical protein P261_00553 [Lachnospiraceae bacterium TWA4]
MIRGTKFDKTVSDGLVKFVNNHSEKEIEEKFLKLGGEVFKSNADFSVRLSYLPNVPLYVNIWFADDEFPPSAKLLVDKSIEHYFTVEDVVTVGDFFLQNL